MMLVHIDEQLKHDWYILDTYLFVFVYGTGWCMVDALIYGTGLLQVEVHVEYMVETSS